MDWPKIYAVERVTNLDVSSLSEQRGVGWSVDALSLRVDKIGGHR